MGANNVTADTFSIAFSPQKENSNAIFGSEKLEDSNEIINTVSSIDNMTTNDVRYELNAATISDAQVRFAK